MSATDELRAELTKRGVEWSGKESTDVDNMTEWECGKTKAVAMEEDDGTLGLGATHLTPAQAIAATLGRGTCHMDVLNTGDCAGYECSEYIMHCNACGHEFGHVLYNEDGDVWMSERPNFCPNCGRKVVDE